MSYTAVIRTLGQAREKYQRLLDSLCAQTVKPERILVYIADGFSKPDETCGKEVYIYVHKGMIAQRALRYDEVETEYILFLDDDVFLPDDSVEKLFLALQDNNADVVSPDVFDNASRGIRSEILMTLSGRMRARRFDSRWAYKVLATGGYSYNKAPTKNAYLSQTNAGPCFLCRKKDFLKIKFQEELWLDQIGYAIGDDHVMFYKMYLMGLKQMTVFGTGIEHLDAGGNLGNKEKELKLIEGDFFFKTVFWHRFMQEPERNLFKRLRNALAIKYFYGFGLLISAIKCDKLVFKAKRNGRCRGNEFVNSAEYSALPKIEKKI